jgi:hypothetical protein
MGKESIQDLRKPMKYHVGQVLQKVLYFYDPDDYENLPPDDLDMSHIGDHFLILTAYDPSPNQGICWYELLRLRDSVKIRVDWLRVEQDEAFRLLTAT